MFEIEISDLASDLPIGLSRGGLKCPACLGGQSGEYSLSITRLPHALAWKCHRASCGAGGYVREVGAYIEPSMEDAARKITAKKYLNLTALPEQKEVHLETRYGIPKQTLSHFRIRYHADSDSIAYPIYSDSIYLSEVGYQLRGPNKNIKMFPLSTEAARGGFYCHRENGHLSDTIVIVEDPVSGLKVSEIHDAFVLWGTHLNYEKIASIVNENYTHALLHLDWDARAKSLKYQAEYKMFFKSFQPVFTTKDPKDLPIEQLRSIYGIIIAGGGD